MKCNENQDFVKIIIVTDLFHMLKKNDIQDVTINEAKKPVIKYAEI